ncbi:hypothetical protein ASPWEDRAFT_336008 [Aspergillus wentii DTO 134E9]|uniref:Uncharacterized protein n=1 Tax=Aspergillus wentii DTO 134E9 TaxID=1073089 RepID=A0A1L9RUI7_ASPWE|nr:uncharacterized protein ASPWEDRAFT_336008 [Aspergillus wentii DTO 134E9]OJJ38592.1 hypothetical protein ASPWEDRAFT_336008 [Aspergillus wentii DTO 134E9]
MVCPPPAPPAAAVIIAFSAASVPREKRHHLPSRPGDKIKSSTAKVKKKKLYESSRAWIAFFYLSGFMSPI